MAAQWRQIWNVPKLSILTNGTPAEDIADLESILYPIAQEVAADDLLRFEIYPPGQPVTMTEPGAVTFLNGASSVTGWLWVNGVRQYMITYDKYAGAVSGYLRPFPSAFVKSLLKAL